MIKIFKQTVREIYFWIKQKLFRFKMWIIALIFGGICFAASFGFPIVDVPINNVPQKKISIEKQLVGKDSKEKARIKSEAISKYKISKFTMGDIEVEIIGDIKVIKKKESYGIQLYARAWKNGKQLGFGKDGSFEIERFLVYDPAILVDDPNGDIVREWVDINGEIKRRKLKEDPIEATKQDLAHTINLVGQENTDITIGKVGNTVATFYPDADPETDTVDGYVKRHEVDETLSVIRAGAGTGISDTSVVCTALIRASSTSNQFTEVNRTLDFYDTSTLGASANITSVVKSVYGLTKANATGSPNLHFASGNAASNIGLASSDYTQSNFGTTSFGSISYAAFSSVAYNDVTLNASGIANISKTGISKFSAQLDWDINNNFTGSWSAHQYSHFYFYSADNGSNRPKLVITYTLEEEERRIIKVE